MKHFFVYINYQYQLLRIHCWCCFSKLEIKCKIPSNFYESSLNRIECECSYWWKGVQARKCWKILCLTNFFFLDFLIPLNLFCIRLPSSDCNYFAIKLLHNYYYKYHLQHQRYASSSNFNCFLKKTSKWQYCRYA